LPNCVKEPAQDNFAGGPAAVALEEFFDRNWFLPVRAIGGSQRAKDIINGSEKDAAEAFAVKRASLCDPNGIINKDIEGAEGSGREALAWAASTGRLGDRRPGSAR
jgi:hypothetical protein